MNQKIATSLILLTAGFVISWISIIPQPVDADQMLNAIGAAGCCAGEGKEDCGAQEGQACDAEVQLCDENGHSSCSTQGQEAACKSTGCVEDHNEVCAG